MRRTLSLTLLVCIVVALTVVPRVAAQGMVHGKTPEDAVRAGMRVREGRATSPATQGTGVVQYDPGSPLGVRFADPPYVFVGNLFDTQNGVPLSPGTIYWISWYQGPVTTKGLQVYLIVPSTAGTPIMGFVGSIQSYATNLVTFAPISVTPPFFAGLSAAAPQGQARGTLDFNQVGYHSQTVNGQGHHGSQRTFSGGSAAARAPIPSQNLVVRVQGNVAIPVELLEFEVD